MLRAEIVNRLHSCKTLDELADAVDEINEGRGNIHNYGHGEGIRAQVESGKCAIVFVMAYFSDKTIPAEDEDRKTPLAFGIEKFLVDAHGGVNTEHAKAWWVFQRAANMFNSNNIDVDPDFEYTRLDPPDCLDSERYFETSWIDNGSFSIAIQSRAMKVKPS